MISGGLLSSGSLKDRGARRRLSNGPPVDFCETRQENENGSAEEVALVFGNG